MTLIITKSDVKPIKVLSFKEAREFNCGKVAAGRKDKVKRKPEKVF